MRISEQVLEDFGGYLAGEEKSGATVEKYVREARRFMGWLAGREAGGETAGLYKEKLLRERTAAGVNGAVAALNGLFGFLGMPECRLKAVRVQRKIFRDEARELTEKEYRRLLAAAKGRKNERLLLVMEAICATGIRVSELRSFTVEAVREGKAEVVNKGKCRIVFLPGRLRKELLRTAGLADQEIDLQVLAQVAEKMDAPELLEVTRVYRKRLDALYPPVPQLRPGGPAARAEEDGAFLV